MDICRDGKKIGILQHATICGLEIEGLWIGYDGMVGDDLAPYTIKDGNVTYNDCWVSGAIGPSDRPHVTFAATSKTETPIQKRKQSRLIPSR